MPQVSAARRVPAKGGAREAPRLSRLGILGQARAGIRRSAREAADSGPRAGRAWRQPHRPNVHRRPLRRFSLQGAVRGGFRESADFDAPRRRACSSRTLTFRRPRALRAAREQAAAFRSWRTAAPISKRNSKFCARARFSRSAASPCASTLALLKERGEIKSVAAFPFRHGASYDARRRLAAAVRVLPSEPAKYVYRQADRSDAGAACCAISGNFSKAIQANECRRKRDDLTRVLPTPSSNFATCSYRACQAAKIAAARHQACAVPRGETLVLLGPQRRGKNHRAETDQPPARAERRRSARRRARSTLDWDAIALRRHIGYVIQETGLFPHYTVEENIALVPRLEGMVGRPASARASQELLALVGLDAAQFLRALSARAFRRAAPARGRGARARRRSADSADGRAVRRARSAHARRDAPRNFTSCSGDCGKRSCIVHARHQRSAAARHANRADGSGRTARHLFAEGIPAIDRAGGRGLRRAIATCSKKFEREHMNVDRNFFSSTATKFCRRRSSTSGSWALPWLIAIAIGVPLGILVARRPWLSKPILGGANVAETIPSLALLRIFASGSVARRSRRPPRHRGADALRAAADHSQHRHGNRGRRSGRARSGARHGHDRRGKFCFRWNCRFRSPPCSRACALPPC